MANYLPANYTQNWGYSGVGQQMYPAYGQSMAAQPQMSYAAAQQQTGQGIIWVDGEVGAKAFQMPQGWSPNTPIPLWDTNDTIIYLKSTNQMGMPNPLQKIHYQMEEMQPKHMGASQAMLTSGDAAASTQDMSQYIRRDEMRTEEFVKKDDLERMKRELMDSINGISAATGSTGRHGREDV